MEHWKKQRGWLEPTALAAFAVWLFAGLITTVLRVTGEEIEAWRAPLALKSFVSLCLHIGDPLMIVLGVINTHLAAIRAWGVRAARIWGVLILVLTGSIEAVGAMTGFPFGDYFYTRNFGPLVGGVLPITIPLAWHLIVTNFLLLVRDWRPQERRVIVAILVATGATLLDWVMEPFATQIKAYWIWNQLVIPPQNYVAWWGVTFGLVWGLAPRREQVTVARDWRPALILGGLLLLFIATRLVYGV